MEFKERLNELLQLIKEGEIVMDLLEKNWIFCMMKEIISINYKMNNSKIMMKKSKSKWKEMK